MKLSVARDFSRFPAGRFKSDGKASGELFREMLVEKLKSTDKLTVSLDGTMGYGSSFLEEAFGGLVREHGFTAAELRKRLEIIAEDESLVEEVWQYISEARDKGRT